ncbi:MAG: transglycosylase domain-containing protein, partial [Thermoleophilaceae bacterium]|nr:transglycosylase domain-containing protein [Thermoleophilaceae bacterium]
MQESSTQTIPPAAGRGRFTRSNGPGPPPSPPRPPRPKLKKLRLALLLLGLGILALISTVFGMLMAVASDLPALENKSEYRAARNSVLYADLPGCKESDPGETCRQVATLTGNQNRILLSEGQISPNIKNAVIAIEDRRFYEHEGVDYRGIARALWQDIRRQGAVQGGSTITQQFVKNALSAQGNRSVLQKLRESALAYHLERKWTKDKVLTQYLNTVYFGNGAYGVESAARTYFGGGSEVDPITGEPLEREGTSASDVAPAEAALLAGMIASPSLYDPVENPRRATQRRDLALNRMLEQRMISPAQHREALDTPVPTDADIDPPAVDSDQPFFSTYLTQQLVDRYGPGVVFGGGLKIKTTLDPELQAAAEQAIAGRLSGIGPSASLVAIQNNTGEIKAMVGGTDYSQNAFNLATNGHRQPGSAFKPFTLVRALADGVSPEATFISSKRVFDLPNGPFEVNNYEDSYSGVASLRSATAASDNAVFADLGLKTGTRRIARLARRMGIRTSISTNPAMTLGGLREGVTPLEMAYAYSTIANKGVRKSGTFSPTQKGPVGIEWVRGPRGLDRDNEPREQRVFPDAVGETAHELMAGVITGGTGRAAQIGEFAAGKTGTTENYGDAWFVGFNREYTVAVWVGYPDRLKYMKTEYVGGPVAGGTYPA